jgi:hypothetical protein
MAGAIGLAVSGCGNTVSNNPVSPNAPTTETYTGTLTVNGATTYAFLSAYKGSVEAVLTVLTVGDGTTTPPSVGLALGTWNGSSCTINAANDYATAGVPIAGTIAAAASLCARVYDAGRLTDPVDYTLQIIHP